MYLRCFSMYVRTLRQVQSFAANCSSTALISCDPLVLVGTHKGHQNRKQKYTRCALEYTAVYAPPAPPTFSEWSVQQTPCPAWGQKSKTPTFKRIYSEPTHTPPEWACRFTPTTKQDIKRKLDTPKQAGRHTTQMFYLHIQPYFAAPKRSERSQKPHTPTRAQQITACFVIIISIDEYGRIDRRP